MEIARQIFHIVLGLVLVSLLHYNILNRNIILIILVFGIFLSLVCIRYKLPVVSWFLRIFDRDDAIIPGQGAITFIAGCLIVLFLFNKDVALASIMVLTFGDTFFGYIKGKLKYPLNNSRFVEGILIGIIAATIGASLFVPVFKAFLGSFCAVMVANLDLKLNRINIDDNLFIPLIAGIVFYFG